MANILGLYLRVVDELVEGEPARFFGSRWDVVGKSGSSGSVRTGRIAADKSFGEFDYFSQLKCLLEIFVGLSREADDDVGSEFDIGNGCLDFFN